MTKEHMEAIILRKLNEGKLDGPVGGEFPARTVTYRRLIRDGIPQYVSIKTNEAEVVDRKYETTGEKLAFLCSAGWMMDDPDVNMYSRLYKTPPHKIKESQR